MSNEKQHPIKKIVRLGDHNKHLLLTFKNKDVILLKKIEWQMIVIKMSSRLE